MGCPEKEPLELDGASLEGLEAVFENSSEDSEPTSIDSSEEFGTKPLEVITTEEAARRLGISARAVINRLKAGSLNGRKTKGKFKEEWRVLWPLGENSSECSEEYSEVSSEPELGTSENLHSDTATEYPGRSLDFLGEQVKTLTNQTQALSFRNGYLEAQLENNKTQLKLLPDYQSKAIENELLKSRIQELENQLAEKNRSWWKKFLSPLR